MDAVATNARGVSLSDEHTRLVNMLADFVVIIEEKLPTNERELGLDRGGMVLYLEGAAQLGVALAHEEEVRYSPKPGDTNAMTTSALAFVAALHT